MSADKAPVNDGIRFRDVLANFNKHKCVLLERIKSSLSTNRIPSRLKVVLVRPIVKKGSKKGMLGYRPISIFSVVALIMEKCFFRITASFCEKCSSMCSSQYGFLQNKGMKSLSKTSPR